MYKIKVRGYWGVWCGMRAVKDFTNILVSCHGWVNKSEFCIVLEIDGSGFSRILEIYFANFWEIKAYVLKKMDESKS